MNNQRLDYNQDMIDNFMLFIHNMQLQQNTVLSSQISQLSIFNSLLHNSARKREFRLLEVPAFPEEDHLEFS